MDEDQINSNEQFYGSDAATSGGDISAEDLALLETGKRVTVMDHDELVEVGTGDEDQQPEEVEKTQEELDNEAADKKAEEEKNKAPATVEEKVSNATSELDELGKDLEAKGVDVEALVDSWATKGGFTEEDYAILAKAGYPKGVIQSIVRGQEAVAQEASRALFETVGGEAAFDALSQFAVAEDPESVEAFNNAWGTGDVKTAKVVLKGIERAYKAKLGTSNRMVAGKPAGASSAAKVTGFANQAEMIAAMSDSRYGRDMEFTQKVEQRVALMR